MWKLIQTVCKKPSNSKRCLLGKNTPQHGCVFCTPITLSICWHLHVETHRRLQSKHCHEGLTRGLHVVLLLQAQASKVSGVMRLLSPELRALTKVVAQWEGGGAWLFSEQPQARQGLVPSGASQGGSNPRCPGKGPEAATWALGTAPHRRGLTCTHRMAPHRC